MEPLCAEPIFNACGYLVSWMEDGIIFEDGYPIAFLDHCSVYIAKNGHYIGHFDDGVFRDRLGCVVGFVHGASRCVGQPQPHDSRAAPPVRSRVVPGRDRLPAAPPPPAKPLLNHSSLSWDRFIAGCAPSWPWETRR